MIEQINEINKILTEEFSKFYHKSLDTGPITKPYIGLTFNYICKYILKEKYEKELVAYCLMNMLKNKEIRALICGHVNNIVFENKTSGHWTYYFKGDDLYYTWIGTDKYNEGYFSKYNKVVEFINWLLDCYYNINTKLQNKAEMTLSQEEILEVTN